MTKQNFKESIRNGNVFLYGYATEKEFNHIKDHNIKFKKDLQPIKKTLMSHIGSDWKHISIESYDQFIILHFNETQNIAVYKVIQS